MTLRQYCISGWPYSVMALLALMATWASPPAAHAQQAFFMGLGYLPGGPGGDLSYATHISADGKVVVGNSSSASGLQAFRWTRETGMVGLGAIGVGTASNASRISDDGSTIIGSTGADLYSSNGTITRPYRWTAETGMQLLPAALLYPRGINADGSIIVGSNNWWSAADGVHAPMAPMTRLYDVSSDGSAFTGYHSTGQSEMWSQQDGLFDLAPMTDPVLISSDGNVIIGNRPGAALRWTKETGSQPFDPLPNGAVPLTATGVSADGAVIVGGASPAGNNLFIWDAAHGTRNLYDLMVNEYGLGASLAGWNLSQSEGRVSLSADGRTLAGYGYNSQTRGAEAWIAYLGTPVPEPSTLVLFALALMPMERRRRCAKSLAKSRNVEVAQP